MTTLKIGDRVMGGEGETFDVGTIHGIDGDMADVGWESGQRTQAHLSDLRSYDIEVADASQTCEECNRLRRRVEWLRRRMEDLEEAIYEIEDLPGEKFFFLLERCGLTRRFSTTVAKSTYQPVGGETDAPSDLEMFVEDLGLQLRSANRIGDRRFMNAPGHPAQELRVYDWPHEHSGARYDRRVLVTVYLDGGFSCALECEGHSIASQRDELERLVQR